MVEFCPDFISLILNMKKIASLVLVTLFILTGCGLFTNFESEESTSTETTASIETAVSIDDFNVKNNFNGDYSDTLDYYLTCEVYNTKTDETVASITSDGGAFENCGKTITHENKMFFEMLPTGLGGYYLFGPGFTVTYYFDLETGEITSLGTGILTYVDNDNGTYALQRVGVDTSNKYIQVIDLDTLEKTVYPKVDEKYGQFGSPLLDDDGKTIVYGAAIGDPNNEKMSVIVATPDESHEIISMSSDWYTITGFSVGIVNLVRSSDGAECTILTDGGDLTCQ